MAWKQITESEKEVEQIMAEDPPAPEKLLEDYGRTNAQGGRLTIANQIVNVPNVQLHLTIIRQLEKRSSTRKINEDANKHLPRFFPMSTTLNIEGHTKEIKKLRMCPFTLTKDVEEWFYSLSTDSITNSVFLRKLYEILNCKSREGESLGDAYKRFKKLLVSYPTNNLNQNEK